MNDTKKDRIHWILDAGHGGMAFGNIYVTKGKRSPRVPPGIYEGEFNRDVVNEVIRRFGWQHCTATAIGPLNPKLKSRVDFVNGLPFSSKQMAFISVHANASGRSAGTWTNATGPRVFVAKVASKESRRLAEIISRNIEECKTLPFKQRPIREANFTVIRRTRCPAVLIECGFMTNKQEAKFLASYIGRYEWAKIINDSMIEYEGR